MANSFLIRRLKGSAALVALVLAALPHAPAQQPSTPLTVQDIYGHGSLTGDPPSDFAWTPDSSQVLYRSPDGDVFSVDHAGKPSVFISHTHLNVLTSKPGTEKDRDHRARYGESAYVWGPDSKHLLLDTAGDIVVYSPENQTGLEVASTGMGSGDDPKFSPNGAFVSYIRDHNLFLRRLRVRGEEVPLSKVHERGSAAEDTHLVLNGEVDWVYEEELDVRSNYFWSPDSKHVAYLESDETSVPEYPITDWLAIHPSVDRQRYPQAGDTNPNVRVGVVSADGGKTMWIKLPIEPGNDYIPRFGWINRETLWIETLTRDHKHLNLYFADAQTGASRLALAQTEDKFFTENYDIIFVDSNFFLRSWRDGHTHIYRYKFNGGNPLSSDAQLVRQLTSGPYEVAAIGAVDDSEQIIYYLSNEGDPLGQQVWSLHWDGTGKQRLSTTGGFHRAAFAGAGGYYLDTESDASAPPRISSCHKRECSSLWESKPLAFKLTVPQRLELKASDGSSTLYGWLLLPDRASKVATTPLIVNPYGGPGVQEVRDEWGGPARLFDELLAEKGFAVLHVDNRGMAGRGRDFEQAAYQNFGAVQLADQLAAVDQVLAKYPQLDKKRLGWWGWSWGGTFTLYALSHSDRFRVGIAGAPVTNWRDYDSVYTERYLGLPAANTDLYHEFSAVNSAASLKGRLLLLHGTGDDNVHIENSVQYIQQLIEAGVPYDFQIYPGKTHSANGPDTKTHLYSRILDEFETYLKPR